MKQAVLTNTNNLVSSSRVNYFTYGWLFLAGLIGPLGFAPFHLPGCTILSLSFLFFALLNCTIKESYIIGFIFGMAYFGLGVSWVIISIHDYGELNYLLSGLITLAFIMYLSLYPALVCYLFKLCKIEHKKQVSILLFCSLWCIGEYIRSNFMTGFPWLIIGTTQIDTPLKYLAPIVGLYGLSFLGALASCLLVLAVRESTIKRFKYLLGVVSLLIIPTLFKSIDWTETQKTPISIGAIQANLSMRDKWDETLFWSLLTYYEQAIEKLLGKQLIILPESAIPLPASYLNDYLNTIHDKALKANSALLLGILQPTDDEETQYFNSIISIGKAHGQHIKRQLVPFGEYIPLPFVAINRMLSLPEPNIAPGRLAQPLIKVLNHPIASLICYEIAYPNLLRQQLPKAQWIVSISDNGWFGKSLASYQQLQMSQFLSLISGRFQIVVNNDGLSSIIDSKGEIVDSLPPFSSGILQGELFPAKGSTPWVILSDYPVLLFCAFSILFILLLQIRRNSNH